MIDVQIIHELTQQLQVRMISCQNSASSAQIRHLNRFRLNTQTEQTGLRISSLLNCMKKC